tara:strand:- start:87 stop:389 length:303 start_codon:yes stop_codon:yes gene_type:complete
MENLWYDKDLCDELTIHIQEIAKLHCGYDAEDIESDGLCLGECTWKEGEFSVKTDCGWMLNIYENEKAVKLRHLIDGLLFPYGYAVGDPYSDRELHVYKF